MLESRVKKLFKIFGRSHLNRNVYNNERTFEQIRKHYEVEKSLAKKLLNSSREERILIYKTMYDELFAKIPNHPRLRRRKDLKGIRKVIQYQIKIFNKVVKNVNASTVLLEFGPGDCAFSFEMCKYVKKVFSVDISNQVSDINEIPENFELIIYDGYHLQIPSKSIDVIYSNQLIEHIHPDDISIHFQLAKQLLKKNGKYIFLTPHRFSGPHDISYYFSDEAEGFHLKEWTYKEISQVLKRVGYSNWKMYWKIKGTVIWIPNVIMLSFEKLVGYLPRKIQRKISRYIFPEIVMVVEK